VFSRAKPTFAIAESAAREKEIPRAGNRYFSARPKIWRQIFKYFLYLNFELNFFIKWIFMMYYNATASRCWAIAPRGFPEPAGNEPGQQNFLKSRTFRILGY